MGIKINATDILNFIKKEPLNQNYTLGVSEFCPYGEGRRLDMFYFNRWNRECRGYEIKISRGDFLQDKKWETYLKFCTYFYFIAPAGIIKVEELPEKIGLIEIDVRQVDLAKESWRTSEVFEDDGISFEMEKRIVRRAKRLHDIDQERYVQLLEGLLIKVIYQKNIL